MKKIIAFYYKRNMLILDKGNEQKKAQYNNPNAFFFSIW